ncbi:biopolymer transporter ExbD [Nibricoccus aquaticus]|uniref:Biopolymer transporter ExbD n=1 Tax=Nibricoccus aquaticus TaxID=2576891 RepID=A0A290Q2H8_9BACT|nr:biopolymer transporter ExbD [Nibricoccus aquaticus]ATC62714.1 biopolymer transporter ExbD [Nibricoccus aquaticus]
MAGAGSAAKSSGPKKARIEIIPLIDVVFFLLATFVLFTLSLNKIESIPINLPKATPPDNSKPPEEPVIIQVSDADSVFWNREPISMSEVTPRLLQYAQTTGPKVLVTGDERAKFGSLVMVLDKVREAQIEQVSIETIYRGTGR